MTASLLIACGGSEDPGMHGHGGAPDAALADAEGGARQKAGADGSATTVVDAGADASTVPWPPRDFPPVAPCDPTVVDCACGFVPYHLGDLSYGSGAFVSQAVDGLGNVYVAFTDAKGDHLLRFHPQARTWAEVPGAPVPLRDIAADVYGGLLALRDDDDGYALHRRDASGRWLDPVTSPVGFFATTTNAGRALGIESLGAQFWAAYLYEPSTRAWLPADPLEIGSLGRPKATMAESGAVAMTMNLNSPLTSGYALGWVLPDGERNSTSWPYPTHLPEPIADADGSSIFVYHERATSDPPTYRVLAGRMAPGDKELSGWVELGAADRYTQASVAYDSSGRALAFWLHRGWLVGSRYSPESQSWSPTEPLGTAVGPTPTSVHGAMSHDGSATLGWWSDTGELTPGALAAGEDETGRNLYAMHLDADGGASPVYALQVDESRQLFEPDVSQRGGHASIAWREYSPEKVRNGTGDRAIQSVALWVAPRLCTEQSELEALGVAPRASSGKGPAPTDAGSDASDADASDAG